MNEQSKIIRCVPLCAYCGTGCEESEIQKGMSDCCAEPITYEEVDLELMNSVSYHET